MGLKRDSLPTRFGHRAGSTAAIAGVAPRSSRATCVRLVACNFFIMFLTCTLTVLSDIESSNAMILFGFPN
jgi:hypothetical protein